MGLIRSLAIGSPGSIVRRFFVGQHFRLVQQRGRNESMPAAPTSAQPAPAKPDQGQHARDYYDDYDNEEPQHDKCSCVTDRDNSARNLTTPLQCEVP
jgi:hypothetical protein